MQNLKYKMGNVKCKMQNLKCIMTLPAIAKQKLVFGLAGRPFQ